MRWRQIGPFRGGRTVAAVGVPGRPTVFYIGVNNGGVWRSRDYGRTWTPLFDDQPTGSIGAIAVAPSDPRTIYVGSGEGLQRPDLSVGDGIYKSIDGGATWRHVGLGDGLQIPAVMVDPHDPNRVFAAVLGAPYGPSVERGGYRSDDGGESWRLANADERLWGRDGDFNEVKVDPSNPDGVYVANVVTWQSRDGGHTFPAFRGAPGGDDYHRLWIDPGDPAVILLAGDQGAVVTVNGGETWSSWYNQPTAQFYHVATDRRFPYWVYGGQQESGSVGIVSRGNDGQITFREWHPVGAEEYGYIAPDPLHPTIVYGGRVTRFDWSTGQVQDVSPEPVRAGKYRWVRTMPLLFSPLDPHVLYFGANVVFRTRDGGRSWTEIVRGLPANAVVNAVREDPARRGLLYAGTERGVYVSFDDGGHWQTVRLNLPPTSVRDLVVHDSDLVVGTHGRGFWILDDITPLRQAAEAAAAPDAYLYRPAGAVRVRSNENTDTPLPIAHPLGNNPPDGAMVDYHLPRGGGPGMLARVLARGRGPGPPGAPWGRGRGRGGARGKPGVGRGGRGGARSWARSPGRRRASRAGAAARGG